MSVYVDASVIVARSPSHGRHPQCARTSVRRPLSPTWPRLASTHPVHLTLRMRRRSAMTAWTLGALLLVGACSSSSTGGTNSGEVLGGRSNGAARDSSHPETSARETVFQAPTGTDTSTLTAAADIVRGRLTRMGVADAVVKAQSDGVAVKSSADGYQLHAAAQRHATTIAPIPTTAVGPCNGPGTPSA